MSRSTQPHSIDERLLSFDGNTETITLHHGDLVNLVAQQQKIIKHWQQNTTVRTKELGCEHIKTLMTLTMMMPQQL